MKIKKYHGNGLKKYPILAQQKYALEKSYSFISCEICKQSYMFCKGEIKNQRTGYTYYFSLKYIIGKEPFVKILNEDIDPIREIHMYVDRHLCLSSKEDVNWSNTFSLQKYTIPWLVEWTYYSEIYKISNVWEGKEAPGHFDFFRNNEEFSSIMIE